MTEPLDFETAINEARKEGRTRAYLDAWTQILSTARQNVANSMLVVPLDRDALLISRAQTVAALRAICEEFGDNDWSDDLHPADVIEKHLARHLR